MCVCGGGVHKYNSIIKCTQVCVCISTVTYLIGHTVVRRGHIQLRTWSATSSTTKRDLVSHKYNSIIKCTHVCGVCGVCVCGGGGGT